jgi:hypothetical protein
MCCWRSLTPVQATLENVAYTDIEKESLCFVSLF